MTRLALAMAAAFVLPAACAPAYAAEPTGARPSLCAPLRTHAAYLSSRWGERPFAPGRIGRGATVVLFINPAKRTWTLIRVLNGGLGCAIGAGRLPDSTRPAPAPIPRPKRSVF